jgi:hypothetical protein
MNDINENQKIEKSSSLLAISLRKFFNFLGFSGVMFIIYGVVSRGTGSIWPPLEKWVNPISTFLTILAVLMTAASIYFYKPYIHPPEKFSKYVAAPSVIASCIIAGIFLVSNGSIPPVIVNGFALLGISGGLFRIQRRAVE